MHVFIFPSKDSTIYNDFTMQNTGKDEMLEISKTYVSGSILTEPYYSRALVEFDLSWLSQSIQDGTIAPNKFYLNLRVCYANEILDDPLYLYVYPISQSWTEGISKRLTTTEKTTGVTWIYTDSEITASWNQSGSDYISSSTYETTASMFDAENSFQETGMYSYELSDMRVDVSNIVQDWLSGSINNYGFLIKRSDSEETDAKDRGALYFYSMNSHTINIPKLECCWDDSSFSTGSLTQLLLENSYVYIKNLKENYNNRENARIRIGCRESYPTKSYATENPYSITKFISESYYSIVDANTEETLVPFDDYSKISCDSNGNYFDIKLNSFHPERFYRIKIKYTSGSLEEYYDNNNIFKIIR